MNIIRAFIFTTLLVPQFFQASQSDANSEKSKPTQTKDTNSKQSDTKGKQPAQKQPAQKEKSSKEKQPTPKEKAAPPTPVPAQKKLKPSAASTAVLLRHSASPGYVAPFKTIKTSPEKKSLPESPVLKKNPIFKTPAKVQNLGNIEIGNSSKKPIAVSSLIFSYTSTSPDEKNAQTHTHKIDFPHTQIISPQKKLAFTITMKNSEELKFCGIKNIQTSAGNLAFENPITDISKPIVLNLTKKGKIQYCA